MNDEPSWKATPGDGTPEGERLAIMNEVLRSMPHGPGTVVIWLDDREHVAEAHYDAPDAESPPDFVSVTGSPDATPSLAQAVAAAMKEE